MILAIILLGLTILLIFLIENFLKVLKNLEKLANQLDGIEKLLVSLKIKEFLASENRVVFNNKEYEILTHPIFGMVVKEKKKEEEGEEKEEKKEGGE